MQDKVEDYKTNALKNAIEAFNEGYRLGIRNAREL